MRQVHLVEGGPPVSADVADDAVHRLVDAKVVTAYPLGSGRWELAATARVGVVQTGDVTVWIQPKLPIARVFFLLGSARRPGWRRDDTVAYDTVSDLVPALARAFVDQADRALRPGLLQGYQELDDALPVLRGRLRESDQLRVRFGLAVPLLVRYDDYQADIPENQILRGATERLLRLPGIDLSTRQRLRGLRHVLAGVTAPSPGRPLPAWRPTRLNVRYHDVLWLAELIMAGSSIDHIPGYLRLHGFLVDMARVFEDFVTAILSTGLARREGTCRAQDRLALDEGDRIPMRPDLVWYRCGTPIAVIDAKYEAEKPSGFPDADYYQLLAYATALGLHDAHLVYAKGNEEPRRFVVRNTAITIHAHTLDLNTGSDALLGQMDALQCRIAARVQSLATQSTSRPGHPPAIGARTDTGGC